MPTRVPLDDNDPRRLIGLAVEPQPDGWSAFCERGTGQDEQRSLLAGFSESKALLTTYPIDTRVSTGRHFPFQYPQVKSISFELATLNPDASEAYIWEHRLDDFSPTEDEGSDVPIWMLGRLPDGFRRDYRFGLGLLKQVAAVISLIEKHTSCTELRMVTSADFGVDSGVFRMPIEVFQGIWNETGRIASRASSAGVRVREAYIHNSLARSLRLTEVEPGLGRHPTSPVLTKAAAGMEELSESERLSLVASLRKSALEVAMKNRAEFAGLQLSVELAALDSLIADFEEMLSKKHKESIWQQFFSNHNGVLQQVFGSPHVVVASQGHVGGEGLDGHGGKITDFISKNTLTNAVALTEIKRPDQKLLHVGRGKKSAGGYRDGVFAASAELSGAVAQVLDQAHTFMEHSLSRKVASKEYDLETWGLKCFVIMGRLDSLITPEQKRSFELFRTGLASVHIVTYDELLEQVKSLRLFLAVDDGGQND